MKVRKGFGTAAIIAVVLAIIVVAAGASYYYLAVQGPSPTSTTKTTTSSTGGQQSSTTSQASSQTTTTTAATSATTTSAASTTSQQAPPTMVGTPANALGNFSQMEVRYTAQNSSYSSSVDFAYFTVGHPVVGGTPTTEVNMTISSSGSSGNSSTSYLLYFDGNWNVTQVTVSGMNFTGPQAQGFAFAFYGFFSLFGTYSTVWTNYYTDLQFTGTAPKTFGSITMDVSTYTANSLTYLGYAYGSVSVSIGKISGTNLALLTNWDAHVTLSDGTTYTATLDLISATRA
ncbi:MAG TPA: hypothetical protein VJR06_00235 [Nitrososphaerales archaeon]|nr:hypothetical protein [Nitrososphaerales archaeon]